MKKINLKTGEIITILTLVGLGVMVVGLTVGSFVLRQGTPLKLFSRATEPTPTPFNGANCVDSDGGNYPDTPGGVTTTISSFGSTRSVEYLDDCTQGYDGRQVLREYYCQGDQVRTFDQLCINNCQIGGHGDYCSDHVLPTSLPSNRVTNGTLTLSPHNITSNGGTVEVTLSLPGIASAPTLSRARYFVSVTGTGVSISPSSQEDLFGSGSPEEKTKSFIITMDQSYRSQNCPAFTVVARAEYYDTEGFLQTVSPVTYSNAVPDNRNGCVPPPSPTLTPTVPTNEGGAVVRPNVTTTLVPTILIPGDITTATPAPQNTNTPTPTHTLSPTPRSSGLTTCPAAGYRCMNVCEPISKFFPAPQYSCANDYFGNAQECCRVIVPPSATPTRTPTPILPSPIPTRRPALCPQLPDLIEVDYVHDNILNVQDFLVGVTALKNHEAGVNALTLSRLLSNLGTNIASIQASCPIITVERPIPTPTLR